MRRNVTLTKVLEMALAHRGTNTFKRVTVENFIHLCVKSSPLWNVKMGASSMDSVLGKPVCVTEDGKVLYTFR